MRNITSSQRREFSTFRVDDRTDAQLRWTRTSALGRISAKDGAEREALAAAERAAREALNGHDSAALNELVNDVQNHANEVGGSDFKAIRAGLDASYSGMGANLALYEDVVPLMAYGLGSRRLVSLAVQQMAAGERAIAVVDELESGLEPHRVVRLLNYLDSDPHSQVLACDHRERPELHRPETALCSAQSSAEIRHCDWRKPSTPAPAPVEQVPTATTVA